MNQIRIVMRRDYREIRQATAFRIILGISLLITMAATAGVSVALRHQPWLGEAAARPLLELATGLILYFIPLAVILSFIWAFASLPLTKEKVNGNVEALMATPLTPVNLWLGKSLAIFLPAYAIAVSEAVLAVLVINLAAILPATGSAVAPVSGLVLGLVIDPLFFFGLLLFMILFALAKNPDVALAPSFLIGFGLMMGIPVGLGTGIFEITSWRFVLWYAAGTAAAWIVVALLIRLLNRQNIVLSGRGN